MDRLRNLFILCFADVVKNVTLRPVTVSVYGKMRNSGGSGQRGDRKGQRSALAYSLADKLYLTHVHSVLEEADTLPR